VDRKVSIHDQLTANNTTAYQLARETGGRVSPGSSNRNEQRQNRILHGDVARDLNEVYIFNSKI
jgi:hypothetical protein